METLTKIQIDPIAEADLRPVPETFTFGTAFTNRMFTQEYSPEAGWHDARIGRYRSLILDPSSAVFHYGQEIFEGTKAYRRADGDINLFRTWDNAERFNRSAERMCMPPVDASLHVEAIAELVRLEHEWVPSQEGASLYIRPVMIATEEAIGVHASKHFLHYVMMTLVGPYFGKGFEPVSVYIAHDYVRAVRGGTGEAKTGGNYAASMYVSEEVKKEGFAQVLWLDAIERRYIEEVGAMNIAFVYEGNHIRTPALSGSILRGITRASVLTLAPDLGYTVSEERMDVREVLRDIEEGRITEVFGMGTAAVIAPVGQFGFEGTAYVINNKEAGPVARHLFKTLTDIQYGRAEDPYGWTYRIEAGS